MLLEKNRSRNTIKITTAHSSSGNDKSLVNQNLKIKELLRVAAEVSTNGHTTAGGPTALSQSVPRNICILSETYSKTRLTPASTS